MKGRVHELSYQAVICRDGAGDTAMAALDDMLERAERLTDEIKARGQAARLTFTIAIEELNQ